MVWQLAAFAVSSASIPVATVQVADDPPTESRTAGPQDAEPAFLLDPVDVVGRRRPALTRPERELGPNEIDDLGAYDIGEAVARATRSLGFETPPMIIINGRRVASPQDFLGFPPDALERLEILPVGSAALYGGSSSERVVNLVLQPHFKSRDGTISAARPTNGRQSLALAGLRQSAIENNDTSLVEVRASQDTALFADARAAGEAAAGDRARVTLRPESRVISGSWSVNRALGPWTASLTGSAREQVDRSINLSEGRAIDTDRSVVALSLNGGLTGTVAGWNLQVGMAAATVSSDQSGAAYAKTENQTLSATLGADRRIFEVDAGPVTTSLTARLARFRSSLSGDLQARAPVTDQIADLAGSFSIPLSRSTAPGGDAWSFGSLLGDATLTFGGSMQEFADRSGGNELNAALSWVPISRLNFSISWSRALSNPTSEQLFDPTFAGSPRKIFDISSGEVVEIQPTYGGNPELLPERSEQVSFGASAGPFTRFEIAASANLQATTEEDGIGALPPLSPSVEAAFPDRFVRNGAGRLLSIDQRLVNLDRSERRVFSSNVTFSIPGAWIDADRMPDHARLQIALNHAWQLRNRTALRGDLEELDRLSGDGGGLSSHELSAQLDGRLGPWGLNGGLRWRNGYRIRREIGRDTDDDLELSSLALVDLKISYSIERSFSRGADDRTSRRGAGTRLEFEIANLFDARPAARLGGGRTAPGYGRDVLDPVGRVGRFTINQRF